MTISQVTSQFLNTLRTEFMVKCHLKFVFHIACTTILNLWEHWSSGPSVTIPLSDGDSTSMGLALFVVFEILDLEDGILNKIWELEETICEFHTDDGCENSLVCQNFIDFTVGSYALCYYEPRGAQFGGMFNKPISLRASI